MAAMKKPCQFFLTKVDNAGTKKGRKRAKKDPNAPKKPLSAYMLFLQDKRADIKAKYPGCSVADIAKKGGEMWNAQKDRTVSQAGMFALVLGVTAFRLTSCILVRHTPDAEVGGESKEAKGAVSERPC